MNGSESKIALLSVTDKTGIVELAQFLVKNGFCVVATGKTNETLVKAGVPSTDVSKFTGHDEIIGGRVKTLHPKIFAGILNDRDMHAAEMKDLDVANIDLVVVNLYPFREYVEKRDASEEEIIENIDIGGVALLRAGSKNFRHVTVVASPEDYGGLIEEMEKNCGSTTIEYRKKMAGKAFGVASEYDSWIQRWFGDGASMFPSELVIRGKKISDLRIGENPHQRAAVYVVGESSSLPIEQLHGKDLSYNNIVDIESALKIVEEFEMPAVSVIKHGNPCGAAISKDNISVAYDLSMSCDPRSSFGGIIALNRPITSEIAKKVVTIFVEAVVAPDFDDETLDILRAKKNLRIIKYRPFDSGKLFMKSTLDCGLLIQERDCSKVNIDNFNLMTDVRATPEMLEDLVFAWRVCKHVKSNAVVIARGGKAIGVGAGQMSRVDSVEICIRKAGNCAGAVLSSDAFFPFADSIQLAVSAGIAAIVQPGGSLRDQEVIDAANVSGVPMYFTGFRSFCH